MSVDTFLRQYEILIIIVSCSLLFVFILMLYYIRRKRLTKCHKLEEFNSVHIRSDTPQSKLFRCAETFKHVSKDVSREVTSPAMHSMSPIDHSLRIQMELNEHYTQSLSFDSSDTKIFKQTTTKKPLLLRQSNLGSKRLLERRGSNISLSIKLTSASSFDSHFKRSISKPTLDIEYFDLSTASNDLAIDILHERLNCLKDMDQEFNKIQTNAIYDLDIEGYYNKNRYSEVLPNQQSRVILPPTDTEESGSSYINANYIKDMSGHEKVYIATQGPIDSTVIDMWRMVWSDKCPVIVMITKLIENNQCKCADYIPEQVGKYAEFVVTVNSIIDNESYSVREITMTNGENEIHKVKHYWYTAWPDHGVPKTCAPILNCVAQVESDRIESQFDVDGAYRLAPVIVHCSAGIGRSGCFMAICMGINQLLNKQSVDVLAIVCSMRTDRGNLVQNISQYKFIHEVLDTYAQNDLIK